MKFFPILLICAAVVAFSPAQAQGRRGRATTATPSVARPAVAAPAAPSATGDEAKAPKTGVRFVICSPAGVNMPSPLYVRSGKEFKAITISSRVPSPRVKPVGGIIEFWDKNPAPAAAEGDKKAPSATSTKLPDPIFTVTVPATVDSQSLCILSPNKDIQKTNCLFMNEKEFPKNGMHVINLSSFPLQVITSESSTFTDKKESKIGVYRREDGICKENSWSFKGEKGQQVSFILSYMDKDSKEYKRIKASSFVISNRQSVINLVVKDTTRNVPKLMTIQLTEQKDK